MFRPLPTHQWVIDGVLASLYLGLVVLVSGPQPLSLVPAVAYAGALAVRRFSPPLSLTGAWLGALLQMTVSRSPGVVDLAVLGVLYASAAYGDRIVRGVSLGSVFVGAIVATSWLMLQLSPDVLFAFVTDIGMIGQAAQYFLALLAIFASSWLLGLLRRTLIRADVNARARDAAERDVAVEQERTAIARDMHDVVAHSLAVVIAQADGARFRARDADPQVVEALATIAQTSRAALGEVRGLLGRLRHREAAGPQPGLDDLARLVDESRAAGLPVRLDAPTPLPEAPLVAQLAVYRIVQEALTNALRHGDRERPVVVGVAARDGDLLVTIASGVRAPGADRGRVDPPPRAVPAQSDARTRVATGEHVPGAGVDPNQGDAATDRARAVWIEPRPPAAPGHGIVGMTERALIAGGSLTAGREGESWVVRAVLPLGAAA